MKSFKVLFMIVLSAIVLIGCKKKAANDAGTDTDTTTPSVTVDYDAISKAMCDCHTELLANMDKLEALTASGNTEGIADLSALIEAGTAKSETCVAAVEAKYSDFDDNPAYEAALVKNCPGLTELK